MSQRDSGYQRKERDAYETPEWVTEALIPHLPTLGPGVIWEPACGSGKMVSVFRKHGFSVYATDIEGGEDFMDEMGINSSAIITNPPYSIADLFIARALLLGYSRKNVIAMLLRTDFDHAKERRSLFAEHKAFAKKVVLTSRIVWFESDDKRASPSYNHAWFIWDWRHKGPPTLAYGP